MVLRRKAAMFRSGLAKALPEGSQLQIFDYKMGYQMQQRYPDKAYFSIPRHNIFERLQVQIGAGMFSHVAKSIPDSPVGFFKSPVGMFVVQIRGVVGDCALPGLSINASRNELSFEWKRLFDQIFGEQKLVTNMLHGTPVGHPYCLNRFSSLI